MSGKIQKSIKSAMLKGAYALLQNETLARMIPFEDPPLLILSYPRSGSSWMGKVLATSPSVAYLREPITQQYLFKQGGRFALVDVYNNPLALSIYRKLSDPVFRGMPPRHPEVVNNLRDFSFLVRKKKHLLIKEVNPRALQFYCEQYKPKVLLLLRHPAAVALSFHQMGWLNSSDVLMETDNPDASAWEKFGYAFGSIMNHAVQALKKRGNHEIVIYRHLAEDPHTEFKKLFQVLQLEIPDNYDDIIQKYCYAPKDPIERWQVERTSRNMIFKWKKELTKQQIADLRAGFMRSPLEYYRSEEDWVPAEDDGQS